MTRNERALQSLPSEVRAEIEAIAAGRQRVTDETDELRRRAEALASGLLATALQTGQWELVEGRYGCWGLRPTDGEAKANLVFLLGRLRGFGHHDSFTVELDTGVDLTADINDGVLNVWPHIRRSDRTPFHGVVCAPGLDTTAFLRAEMERELESSVRARHQLTCRIRSLRRGLRTSRSQPLKGS